MLKRKAFTGMVNYLIRAYSGISAPTQRSVNSRISRKLPVWIAEKRFCLSETLIQVAEYFGASEEELSYYFATVVGERFTTFRKRLRLEEARQIIRDNPELRILVVANMVGIVDKCNFRKQFFAMYGYSPSEWQKKCLEARRGSK